MTQERERVMLRALRSFGLRSLRGLDVLEVGCGTGYELARLVVLGAEPDRLYGIDIDAAAIEEARRRTTATTIVANASQLPFPDGRFDVVMQLTALSSMLDPGVRTQAAREMMRVLRSGGLLLSHDFRLNPRNRATVGIRPAELRRLFNGIPLRMIPLTLAPPIARPVARRSPWLASILGGLPMLRSHILAIGRRPPDDTIVEG